MYEINPLPCNPAALDGLSEKLVVSHQENNYGGAVRRNAMSGLPPALNGNKLQGRLP